ncbi:MAG: TetR/AcrR family transcriptional regulator [Eubacteriales bacterium]|nr:TetR/AcrR family transcriptional regulator [Eubacteriales bacterium]
MARKGLTNENIMAAATDLVNEKGYDNFSLRELAARLSVKPPSLYNHIDGIDAISSAVGVTAAHRMGSALKEALMSGKDKEGSFLMVFTAYRNYATENPELYKAISHLPEIKDEKALEARRICFQPIRDAVALFITENSSAVHFYRAIRNYLHGFVSMERRGYMQTNPMPSEESFQWAAQMFLKELKEAEDRE